MLVLGVWASHARTPGTRASHASKMAELNARHAARVGYSDGKDGRLVGEEVAGSPSHSLAHSLTLSLSLSRSLYRYYIYILGPED